MKTIASPHAAILRAVQALIGDGNGQKPIMVVEEIISVDWASATFDGERHRFALRLEGTEGAVAAAMARIVTGIAEADIPLHGRFVAEASAEAGVKGRDGARMVQPFTLSALTITD